MRSHAGLDTDPRDAHPRPRIALYAHIPFCETKCPYCDFNTYARIEPMMPAYLAALRTETALWGHALDAPAVGTVFFGGGTPSYIPTEDMAALLESVRRAFDLSDAAEVTIEANPGDLDEPTLARYLEIGVDRLSIGVQSFDDRMLDLLGRRHTAAQAVDACEAAARAGFQNVSIDLMYGLPDQDLDTWSDTLHAAAGLAPQHLSLYCLTLEGGTPMEEWVASGRVPDPDPDLAADMYLMAEERMAALGYRHYEISNWAMPGLESRHNLTYWRNLPYLGVGPGAHSYLDGRRSHNLRSPREYVRRLEGEPGRGAAPSPAPTPDADPTRAVPVVESVEAIGRDLEMAETMMMGLRLDTGVAFDDFAARFDVTLDRAYGHTVAGLESAGLLERASGSLRLTGRGRLLGNEVFSRFVAAQPART